MKKLVSGICSLLLAATVTAQSNSPITTFSKKDLTLKEVVESLQRKEKLSVMYDNAVNSNALVHLPSTKLSLDQLVKILGQQTGLDVKLINNNIYIKNKPANNASVQQEKITVKGTVLSKDDNSPIPGATIAVNGKVSAVSGQDGSFALDVPKGATLEFKSIGLSPVKYVANAGANNIKIEMSTNVTQLNSVVVTALGIKREEKALGYAVTKMDNEDFTNAISNNWTNNLSGKVAGVNILKSNGGPGGSNKIILRGENTFDMNNEALIVIDGVITSASSGRMTGTGSGSYLDGDSPTDFGTSLNDINPEDIENVTVLKGPGASALYGSRGANGAIIITTKSGSSIQKGLGVSFNSNSSFESISRWPDYQYEYGQGAAGQDSWYSYLTTADGSSTKSTSSAWGPKFDGQSYFQYDPQTRTTGAERTPWVPYTNNRKDFFETGKNFTNALSIEGGNKNTNARLSFTNLNNTWIVPNTGYTRNTIAISLNHKVTEKLKISTKVNYTNKKADNLPSTGYNNQTIMYFIRGLVPNANIDWFRDYWVPGKEQLEQTRPFSSLLDNPFLQVYEMLNTMNRHSIVGNVSANYDFTKNLSLTVRSSLDYSYDARSQRRPKGTQKFVDGMYRTQNIFNQETNMDFMLRYSKSLVKNVKADISFGGSRMHNKYNKDEVRAEKLRVPGEYNFANSKINLETRPYHSEYAVNSLYGLIALSYKDFLYFDATLRNDWTSTLAVPADLSRTSYFYDSYNVSTILSELFELPRNINYLKLRGSIATVGSGGTTPYLTMFGYVPQTNYNSGLSNPTYIANEDLEPSKTVSYEVGTEMKLFGRFNLDVAVYQNNSKNQIIRAPIDPSSGFRGSVLNAGEIRNRGIEIAASYNVLKNKKGLNWTTNITYSTNKGKILTLAKGLDTYILGTGPANRGQITAIPGGYMGDLYGLGYERAPDGQIIYNDLGYPILGQSVKYLGNTNPDYRFGWGNEFKWKQFRFNFLFDSQFGGVGYSLTHAVLAEEGKLKKTIPGRYNGIIGDGVVMDKDGNYIPNTTIATNIQAYYNEHFKRDNVEANTFSTDFIKLRETRIDYTLDSKLVRRLKLQRASVGIFGRDLFMITDWPAFDPEFGTLSGDDINKGFEIGQFPSTRTIGINLTVGF